MAVQYQVIIIYAATKNIPIDIPVRISCVLSCLSSSMQVSGGSNAIATEKQISEKTDAALQSALKEFKAAFRKG